MEATEEMNIFEFAKAQRKYWEEKRDDNNRSGTEQSKSSFEWRRLPRDLFRRWRLLWLSDKTKGEFRDSHRRPDAYGNDIF